MTCSFCNNKADRRCVKTQIPLCGSEFCLWSLRWRNSNKTAGSPATQTPFRGGPCDLVALKTWDDYFTAFMVGVSAVCIVTVLWLHFGRP
jgi:hypothetical protein